MFSRKKIEKHGELVSELRKDAVSGEWVLVATDRSKRLGEFNEHKRKKLQPQSSCPFEDTRINGEDPLLWYSHPESGMKDSLDEWFVQVIANKYPAVMPHVDRTCAVMSDKGPYERMDGVGYHEIIVTRPHERSLGSMTIDEASLVIRAYRERFATLKKDPCVAYILVFHNDGEEAGASISHPHSQLIAFPIIPPDVARSIRGSTEFYNAHGACIHCRMIAWELEDGERIVFENEKFIVIAPYASRVSFEIRIYPREHAPHFDLMPELQLDLFAQALTVTLKKLQDALGDPAYNFFIHTAPTNQHDGEFYHWHTEILPKTAVPAGLELGTGVDVVTVAPENVPGLLA